MMIVSITCLSVDLMAFNPILIHFHQIYNLKRKWFYQLLSFTHTALSTTENKHNLCMNYYHF